MKKNKEQKKYLKILLLILLVVAVGIGYAALTQKLSIGGNLSYDSMKWDVGFKSATNGGGTIESDPVISNDKKSIIITCQLGTSTSSETCIANAVIENNSTFNVELESNPTITYDNTYVKTVDFKWDNSTDVKAADVINADETKNVIVTITTKAMTPETLPTTSINVPITIEMNWIEKDAVQRPTEPTVLLSNDDFINGSYYATGNLKTENPYGQLKTIEGFIEPQKIRITVEDSENDINSQNYKVVYSAYDASGNILNPNDLENAWFDITSAGLELDLPTLYPNGTKFKLDIMRYNSSFFDIPETAIITVTSLGNVTSKPSNPDNLGNVLLANNDFINGCYYNDGTLKVGDPYGKLKTTHQYIEPQKIRITIEDSENNIATQSYKVVYSAYDASGNILNPGDTTNAMFSFTSNTLDLDLPVLYPSAAKYRVDILRYNSGSFYEIPSTATITVTSLGQSTGSDTGVVSVFANKKIDILGDSITNQAKYIPKLKSLTGASEIINHGISGQKVTEFALRTNELDKTADLIIMFGGTNDYWHKSTTIGQMGDTTNETFYGALKMIYDAFLENHPNAQYLFIAPPYQTYSGNTETKDFGYGTLNDFRNAMETFCNANGIKYYDASTMTDWKVDQHTTDGVHPNQAGGEVIAENIFNFLQNNFN